jgi:hypothetical protein
MSFRALLSCLAELPKPLRNGVETKPAFARYREAVVQQSPGSRSALWVKQLFHRPNPNGVLQGRFVKPRWGLDLTVHQPRVRCATLGFVVQPLRGKDQM